jgi:Tol biopolymer transport system component
LLNLKTGDTEKRTFSTSVDESPIWLPDGKSFMYASALTGTTRQLFIEDLDSSRNPHLIRTWPRHIHFTSWSPDGKWLAAYDYTSTNGSDCYAISVDSKESKSIAGSEYNESNAQFSPDGRWVAFQSNESGRFEIYVVSFPKLESKRQISEDGGTSPFWDRNGKLFYYLSNGFMVAQPVEIRHEFTRGKPVKMFQTHASEFLVSPDGQRFYLVNRNIKRPNPPLHLITNWFEELIANSDK